MVVDERINADEVRYFLKSSTFTKLEPISEPINWKTDEKELSRSSKSFGVFTTQSGDLEFTGKAASLIQSVYEQYGTEVDLSLIREVKGGLNDGWLFDYEADFDLKTYSYNGITVSVQFLTGGLQAIIDSQKREKYELERTKDINGNNIGALDFRTMLFDGRRIFLESEVRTPKNENGNRIAEQQASNPIGSTNNAFVLNIEYESDNGVATQVGNLENFGGLGNSISANFFYLTDRSGIRTIKISGQLEVLQSSTPGSISIYVAFYETFPNQDPQRDFSLTESVYQNSNNYGVHNFEHEFTVEIPENYGAALLYQGSALDLNTIERDVRVQLDENSVYEATENNFIPTYEAGQRISEIMTGRKNAFKSELFGGIEHGYNQDGKWYRTGIASGKHIRNLPDAKTSMSIDQFFSLDDYFNLGWSVENVDGIEKWVVEEKKYFFQNKLVHDLGEISNFEISAAEDMLYRSLTFGNKKAGSYEEVQGLQEYNAETTYQTFLKTAEQEYDVQSDIRVDPLGAELARRKQYETAPNEDTSYDKDNFLFEFSDRGYTLRKWQEDYAQEPIVYDPESAFNLNLTPLRSMYRHAYWFNCGLTRNLDRYTRYSDGNGKDMYSQLLTESQQRNIHGETLNSILQKPLIKAEYITFDKPIDYKLKRIIFGKTEINGRFVPNTNLLFKCSYRGTYYYGWIVNLKLNDPGEWKLILKY